MARARDDAASEEDLLRLSSTFKVLADRTRLKMVMGRAGRRDVWCADLAALVGTSDSAVSHHLRRLKDLSLVKSRRDGQILYYSLDDAHVAELLKVGLEHVME